MKAEDLHLLASFFPAADIEWRPGAMTRDKSKALALAYLTARAIMDRLDAVCGPADWRNEFTTGPDGGVLCGISIRVERELPDATTGEVTLRAEWITKWDGAENTDVEGVKGGLSSSMKRAAVQWGIGRYLYDLPAIWAPLDGQRFAQTPSLPREFVPNGDTSSARTAAAQPSHRERAAAVPPSRASGQRDYASGSETKGSAKAEYDRSADDRVISDGQRKRLWAIAKSEGGYTDDGIHALIAKAGYTSTGDIQRRHYDAICEAAARKDLAERWNVAAQGDGAALDAAPPHTDEDVARY